MLGLLEVLSLAVATTMIVNLLVRFALVKRNAKVAEAAHTDPNSPKKTALWMSLLRNVLLLLSLAYDTLKNFFAKCILYAIATVHFIFSRETNSFGQQCADRGKRIEPQEAVSVETKTIIFVRHAESLWNYAFNRGINFGLLWRLLTFSGWEAFLLCDVDSVVLDSPLSTRGIAQSFSLQKWLSHPEWGQPAPVLDKKAVEELPAEKQFDYRKKRTVAILKNTSAAPRNIVITSNLRRAISTGLIALNERLISNPFQSFFVNSNLQEATRNPDGLTLSRKNGMQIVSQLESELSALGANDLYKTRLNTMYNEGNKTVGSRLIHRLESLAHFTFDFKDDQSREVEAVVILGHSAWFRNFFKRFMPIDQQHVAKEKKIANCGVVTFELMRLSTADGRVDFRVNPDTVSAIYGAFK